MDQSSARGARPRDRKSQLATVAAGLFRERGYHGVAINDIAAEAGVTGPALYRHFADKQAILAHVLLSGLDEMIAATTQALDSPEQPAGDRVETLLRTLAGLAVERREISALWRWEGPNLDAEGAVRIRERSAGLLDSWSKALRSVRPKLDQPEAELLCWAALSVLGSVAVHRTSIAKRRFERLLTQLAGRALHANLPEYPGDPAERATSGVHIGTPARREQLLTAATELFSEHGYQPVSMADIGRAAGIAGPSVYRHFTGKAALLAAICQRAADRLTAGAEHALRASAPPDETEGLRRLIESYVHTLTDSAELAVSFSTAPQHIDARDQAELVRVQRDYVEQWVRLYRTMRPELSRPEAKITVHAALTIANDLSRTRRISARPQLRAELVAVMCAVLDIYPAHAHALSDERR